MFLRFIPSAPVLKCRMTKPSTCRQRSAWSVLPVSTDRVPPLWQALAVIGLVIVIMMVLAEATRIRHKPLDAESAHLVDINFASEAELDTLPGIGPALAEEIIRSRPYSNAEELDRVKGISKKMAARLLPLVKAGQGRRAADQ
jgi:hypothetical protein